MIRRVLFYVIGVALVLTGTYVLLLFLRVGYQAKPDLFQDYTAAKNLLQGRSIYSAWNDHPPFNALMILPLALLPFRTAFRLWGVLTVVAFLFSIWLVMTELKIDLRPEHRVALVGAALCWYPLQGHVALGQLSIVVCVCLIGGWMLLRRGQDVAAGVLIGLACLTKLFPGLVLALMLFQRRWRAFGAGVGTFFAGFVGTLMVVGRADVVRYLITIAPADTKQYGTYPLNVSLVGVWRRLFTPNDWFAPLANAPGLGSVLGVISIVLVLVFVYADLRRARQAPRLFDRQYILAILAMILVSPISWQHIFLILILPFGWLVSTAAGLPRGYRLLVVVALLLCSLPDVQIARWIMRISAPGLAPWYMGLPLLAGTAGLLVLGFLVLKSDPLIAQQNQDRHKPARPGLES